MNYIHKIKINNNHIITSSRRKIMKLRTTILSLFLLLSVSAVMFGQSDDLKIFGYFQNNYTNFNVYTGDNQVLNVNSFLMQQMNLFFQKNFNPEFSAFVDFEFTNSYSSQDSIGGFKIQEAWFKYSPSSLLNVKAGVFIPRFNNFNEIKNRTVLMPYVYRPIAYETYFFSQFGTGEFVPTSANLQVYGDIPVGELRLNYTGFYGNSETNYLNKNTNFWGPGQDPTNYKLVGGRIGAEYDNLQLGASATYDRKNLDKASNGYMISTYNLGNVARTRVGAYLNYSLKGFELESELIKVYYNLSDAQKQTLATNPFNPTSFDKTYYHANLLYNFTDKLGAYVGYDYLKAQDNFFTSQGLKIYNYGVCYKVLDSIILKAQYEHQNDPLLSGGVILKDTRNDYLLGASISF